MLEIWVKSLFGQKTPKHRMLVPLLPPLICLGLLRNCNVHAETGIDSAILNAFQTPKLTPAHWPNADTTEGLGNAFNALLMKSQQSKQLLPEEADKEWNSGKHSQTFEQGNHPSFIRNWPSLQDLILLPEHNDDEQSPDDIEPPNKQSQYMKFIERLQQLADTSVYPYNTKPEPTVDNNNDNLHSRGKFLASLKGQMVSKGHNIKRHKNSLSQYMAPCHFKICNMGRKRDGGIHLF